MYLVKYGGECLYDPRKDLLITDAIVETNINTSDSFSFIIHHGHPLYDKLRERDIKHPVSVWQDDELIFYGDISNIGSEFQLSKKVKCRGELAWLNDSLVRPYSTDREECPSNPAPDAMAAFFEWLINNHNNQVENEKRFIVGINEGQSLENTIYSSNTACSETGATIIDKIINEVGGYIRIRHEKNNRYIDLLKDFPDDNSQIIDFGVNLLDYVNEMDASGVATFVVPSGSTITDGSNTQSYKQQEKLTVSSSVLPTLKKNMEVKLEEYNSASEESAEDALAAYLVAKMEYNDALANTSDGVKEGGYFKQGDMIYSIAGVEKYGWIGATVDFDDVSLVSGLIKRGILALKKLETPVTTIDISAVDLAMINPKYKYIRCGQYVRVRSKPHNFDSYMLCSGVKYDLMSAENNDYTLGTTFDTLTGQQNKRINALNNAVNHIYQATDKISQEAKNAAEAAGKAVISTYDEYALSDSSTIAPSTGWSKETPKWVEGKYIWRRVISKYGDGRIVTGKPALMTGNTGADGQDSIFLQILSSNGNLFKNSTVSTTLTVTIIVGDKTITSSREMHEVFGPNSSIEWEQKRFRETVFTKLDPNDPRLSDNGFILTLEPKDVYTQTVFNCILNY